jgi:zinc transporter
MVSLLECQADRLGNVAARLNREIGDMEDQILAERVHVPRAKLATLRRLAVRLHRHFAPEHRALQRLCGRSPAWFRDTDIEGLKDTTEALGEIVGDLDAIQERAKLLQEELAGRALKETNRNMVILSVVTAVFMPVTLITGIFGMNVAGLPGLEDGSAFWWVMLGMAGGGLDGAVATALEAVVVAPHLSRKRFRVCPYTRRPGIVPAAAGIRSAHPRR